VTPSIANVTFIVARGTFAEHNVPFCMDDVTFGLLEATAVVQRATRASGEAALGEIGVALRRAAGAPFRTGRPFGSDRVLSPS